MSLREVKKLSFRHVIVDPDNPRDPHCKAAADLDGDGYPDLLAASASGEGLYWYRYPDWSKHRIAGGSFTTDMVAVDIDGDGHTDVIIPNDDGLIFYRNPISSGGDVTGHWEPINIGTIGARMHDVAVADLDGDGKLDIVTRHQSGFGKMMGNRIHIWRQNSPRSWEHRMFPCPHGEGLAVADINGDGRPDVIIGGRWYENPGDILSENWIEHCYVAPDHFAGCWTRGDVCVAVADLNLDGKPEIVLSPSEGVGHLSWFEIAGSPNDEWTEHILDPNMDHAHGLALGDIDGDGLIDIVYAKMHQATPPQEIAICFNESAARSWSKQTVATTGSHNIVLVDIGNTGRLDIFGSNWNDRAEHGAKIEYWANEG